MGQFGFPGADEARIAAQVVTGVGLLGAGAIFKHGGNISGLTTAAGLWAVAAIGITSDAGIMDGAALATGIALFVLIVLGWVERRVRQEHMESAMPTKVSFDDVSGFGTALSLLDKIELDSMDIAIRQESDGTTVLTVPVPPDKREVVRTLMLACDGVIEAE